MQRIVTVMMLLVLSSVSVSASAQEGEWILVTGADVLKNFVSGMEVERTLPNGEISRAKYNADGSEIAAELANPNTAVATLTLRTQYRWFTGDLPDAASQSSPMLLFQPSFPFKRDNGDMILWRPALPLLIEQPVFDPNTATFDGVTGLGDFAFDLAYAPKIPGGLAYCHRFYYFLANSDRRPWQRSLYPGP